MSKKQKNFEFFRENMVKNLDFQQKNQFFL